jgi:hypothetical protein
LSACWIGEVSANALELVDRGDACCLDVSERGCQVGGSVYRRVLILAAQPLRARPVEERDPEFGGDRRQGVMGLDQIGAVDCDQANAGPNEYNQLVDWVRSRIQL